MSKKAFVGTIEVQIAVLAETETEAQQLVLDSLRSETLRPGDIHIQPMTFQPDGWDDNSILYNDGAEEVTVKEVLDKLKGVDNVGGS